MNWPWSNNSEDDEEEAPAAAPVAVATSSAAERRAARQASQPARTEIKLADLPPDPGEKFYASFIGFISVVAPLLVSALIGVSTGYFLADFQLGANVPTVIGMSGGILVAGVDLAIVMQKKRASKYGEDEKAIWLLTAAILFGIIDVLTMYIYLQVNLTRAASAEVSLTNIPLAGILVGIGNGSLFVLVRAAVYHLALYASAWGLGTIQPSPEKLIKWEMQKHIQHQTRAVLAESLHRSVISVAEEPRQGKDLLATMQAMMQQLTEMQVQQNQTSVTADWRTVTPPKVAAVKPTESEAAPDGQSTFQ